jgi:integrase
MEVSMKGKLYLRGRVWWLRYHHHGEQIRKSCETSSKEKALAKLDLELANLYVFDVAEPASVTLEEIVRDLITYHRAMGKTKAANVVEARWNNHLKGFFGKAKVKKLTTAHFNQYREHRVGQKAMQPTVDQELATLRRAFSLAHDSTPPKVMRKPKIPMSRVDNVRQRFFTADECQRIFEAASREGLWARVFVEMLYLFGWRRGELINLRVANINVADSTVRIFDSKNGDPREVPMPPRLALLAQQLVAGKRKDEPVFPCTYHSVVEPWTRIMKSAGIEDGHIHDFRRTSARSKRLAGVPENVVMELQGWRTAEMFRRYSIVNLDDKRKALELLESKNPAQN